MKTTKLGFIYPDDEEEFIKTFVELYNSNDIEELTDLYIHVFANNNIVPTKSNVLDYLKQKKVLLPVISLSHIDEVLPEIANIS